MKRNHLMFTLKLIYGLSRPVPHGKILVKSNAILLHDYTDGYEERGNKTLIYNFLRFMHVRCTH